MPHTRTIAQNLPMDTDDLSQETYRAIIIEAERFHHDLTLQFGFLASDCEDEAAYIDNAEQLIQIIKAMDDADIDDLFWGNPPNKVKLHQALDRILENIEGVKAIPIGKRTFD